MTYASTILADGPVRYWRMDDTSGTTMVDATGNLDGTYHNTPTFGEPSLLPNGEGTSVRFTAASTEYADVSDSVSTRYTEYTIECWAKQASNGQQTIIEAYPSSTSQRDRNVYFGGSGGSAVAGTISGTTVRNGDVGLLTDIAAAGTALEAHYIVMTFVYTGGVCTEKLYVDCDLIGTNTNSSYAPDTSSTSWLIGKDSGLGGTWAQNYLDGWVQELAIYDYVLTQTHIDNHCEMSQPPPTYVGLWGGA